MGGKKKYTRKEGTRRSRKMYLIATEGAATEPIYFQFFNSRNAQVWVDCHGSDTHKSAPDKVLARMERLISKKDFQEGDEAWIVIDRDQWSDQQIQPLSDWSKQEKRYGLAVSVPQFEYWLVLHFEEGNRIQDKAACLKRLKRYLPDFEKGNLDMQRIAPGMDEAVQRARSRHLREDGPPPWPRAVGSTVYQLVERLRSERNPGA